ncbi:SGNH/GDSL hydrolase family protein [Microbacterium jepli]|uniref:SGNH/GDSL hydrolase family protein n=1 Tax=Microbacterium sp. 1P10UE TaxID=3132288 RepID=UPI0039A3D995
MTTLSAEPGSLTFNVQFAHPDKILSIAASPTAVEDHIAPLFHGVGGADVAAIRELFAASVTRSATELIADPTFADELARLPFKAGDVIVAFGDSLTDDLQSWAKLLSEALRQLHGTNAPVVIDAGRSGDTTTHLLERLPRVLALRPDWVIMLVGTNDGKAFAYDTRRSLVSPTETGANAASLDAALRRSGARMLWALPPLADEQVAGDCALWKTEGLVWSNEHLSATREAIKSAVQVDVDVEMVFRTAGAAEHLLRDGLHPNASGQILLLRSICDALVSHSAEAA